MSTRVRAVLHLIGAVLVVGAWAACSSPSETPGLQVPGGSADAGARAIERFGCGSCHTIPDIDGADANVGPPLTDFGQRTYIAGELLNTPRNLIRWIRDPQGVEPGTAMPDLGVSRSDARDIAAYLESLGDGPPQPAPGPRPGSEAAR